MKAWLRGAWRSRTLWAAWAIGAAGIVEQQLGLIAQWVPRATMAHVMMVCAVVIAAMRVLTSTALNEKGTASAPPPDPPA